MQINPHIFREFSIRGVAEDDLYNEVVICIGRAIGAFFRQRGGRRLVIGRDVRVSSPRIGRALIDGLLQSGINVIDLGSVPTPVLNFSTDFYGADGGVMVTASHNPPNYNGLKIRAEQTLHGDALQEIYRLAQRDLPPATETGTRRAVNPLSDYLHRLRSHAQWAAADCTLKIVVDGGNGANGRIVSQLLSALGCEVVELFCEPDGRFPNRKPDPTAAGATKPLAAAVLAENAHLGVAYDGDGDRLAAVDEQGRTIYGDQLLMLLARDVLHLRPARVVYEVLCSQALADDVRAHGGTPIMTPSGYAFVHRAMHESGAALGGELSGHFFFDEPDFRFDDAILATLRLLNVVIQAGRPLSQLVAALPSYHASPEVRLPCPDERKPEVVTRVQQQYRGRYKVELVDGARIHFPQGWALVRQSNTQPVISMRFEALTPQHLTAIRTEVQSLVESTIAEKE
ncbi:MAG: phosphomannomutase/phosphoglucomutase [Anaerolineae bacterium]